MMTAALTRTIKNSFPDVSDEYIAFLKNAKKLRFNCGNTHYKIIKSKVYVSTNTQNDSETLVWALLHEVGHFLAINKPRILKCNYGFKNGGIYNRSKALKHEENTVTIQVALGRHFGLKPLSAYAIENILNPLSGYTGNHASAATIRRRASRLNVTQLKAEFTRRNTYLEKTLG